MQNRLFIVSNRLPVTIKDNKQARESSGGLVSAINSFIDKNAGTFDDVVWTGAAGCSAETWRSISGSIAGKKSEYLPVFIPGSDYIRYYDGMCNSAIWPLFHYFPSYAEYDGEDFAAYQKINARFADVLLKHVRPTDTVWIHDYHLLPLSKMLKKEIPELTIGLFLHIPFPSYEIFRLLPRNWQEDILTGMLGADLIGFHTIDYAAHFLQTISSVLGIDNDKHMIHFDNRIIKVDVFPISIDFDKFYTAYDDKSVVTIREKLKKKLGHQKVIFSVDRLDYTKGVQNRLQAFDYFLKAHPEYREKIVFLMVIVPSRDNIQKYAERKKLIDGMISQINSRTGNIHWTPIVYLYNHLDFNELVALFTACDLALITPLRDGMNLVSKEFVASRKDKKGVLILSEMAGAARELTEAIIINPNDIAEIASRIKEGLQMPAAEQSRRLETMQKRVAEYDVTAWAKDFMKELKQIKNKQQSYQVKFLDSYSKADLYDAFRDARKRLFLLDYDGTMMPFKSDPNAAVPGRSLISLLAQLGESAENDVYIVSGRQGSWLQTHFGDLPIGLVAEHGAVYKHKFSQWMTAASPENEWKTGVRTIMESYVPRCVNSAIEEKDFSIVWHYRNCNAQQGKLRALELGSELNDHIARRGNLQVLMGNKIVEVRDGGFNKGKIARMLLKEKNYDFVFAAGDDRTDEDMFSALNGAPNAFTIKVGPEASYAHFNLHTAQMVTSLLEGLGQVNKPVLTR